MIIVVIGTPDSGKSALAEKLCCELAGSMKKYYIATMVPYGEEGLKRVAKHRKMREGKGFETIERPVSLDRIDDSVFEEECTCLLECVSNPEHVLYAFSVCFRNIEPEQSETSLYTKTYTVSNLKCIVYRITPRLTSICEHNTL